VGYNGIDFCGSQKNKDVRTVEEEIEKALFKARLIAKHNFGDLNKIAWNRATRTDKRVHAL
jgi:tRNA pseudouridine38-40 synthase